MQDAEALGERGGLRKEFFGWDARFVCRAAQDGVHQCCGGSFARDFY